MTPVEEVSTSELVEEIPSLDAECVLVLETRWHDEDPVDQVVLGRLQQPIAEPDNDAGIEEEEAHKDNDKAQIDDEASIVRELSQSETERTDSSSDVVMTRLVHVPQKPRAESAQVVDAPSPSPRRIKRLTVGVHSNIPR